MIIVRGGGGVIMRLRGKGYDLPQQPVPALAHVSEAKGVNGVSIHDSYQTNGDPTAQYFHVAAHPCKARSREPLNLHC